jgi:hypothetical protein
MIFCKYDMSLESFDSEICEALYKLNYAIKRGVEEKLDVHIVKH